MTPDPTTAVTLDAWRVDAGLADESDFLAFLADVDGTCPALCDHRCEVEPDGTCPHGHASVLLAAGYI